MADQGVSPLVHCGIANLVPHISRKEDMRLTGNLIQQRGPKQVFKQEPKPCPVFADTECAHALLDLAKSVASFSHNGCLSDSSWDSQLEDAPQNTSAQQSGSILKNQLEGAELIILEHTSNSQVVPTLDLVEVRREEEVKRIKLDHNYAWVGVGEERRTSSKAESHLASSKLGTKVVTLHAQREGRNQPVNGSVTKITHGPKLSRDLLSPRQTKAAKSPGPPRGQRREDKLPTPPADMYEPEDSKYEKFNLLLKCLTNEVGMEEECSSRKRYDSNASSMQLSVSSGDCPSASSEDSMNISEGGLAEMDNQFYCVLCLKSFTKKRYLTKHFRRMHPTSVAELPVPCPSCKGFITKSSLKQHRLVCGGKRGATQEVHLADCQFCGMRMRRHVLVRHLAIEHCQDVAIDGIEFPDKVNNNEDTDGFSDSSTLSGSEHDHSDVLMATSPRQPPHFGLRSAPQEPREEYMQGTKLNYKFEFSQSILSKNMVKCQLCDELVSRMRLTEHLASVHNADTATKVQSTETQTPPAKPSPRCNHSMLQRFLSDTGNQEVASEECQSCVGRLVGGQTLSGRKQVEIDSPCFERHPALVSPIVDHETFLTSNTVYTANMTSHEIVDESIQDQPLNVHLPYVINSNS